MAARMRDLEPDELARLERVVMLGRLIRAQRETLTQYDAIHKRRRAVLVKQIEEAEAEFAQAKAVQP